MGGGHGLNQHWRIRFVGTVHVGGLPRDILKLLNMKPGLTAKIALFEIQNSKNPKESGIFVYGGAGVGLGWSASTAGIPLKPTEFVTDTPVRLSDFGGPTQFANISGLGHAPLSVLVFNDRIRIQGRGFWDTLWWGDQGIDVSGFGVGTGLDISATAGLLQPLSIKEATPASEDQKVPRAQSATNGAKSSASDAQEEQEDMNALDDEPFFTDETRGTDESTVRGAAPQQGQAVGEDDQPFFTEDVGKPATREPQKDQPDEHEPDEHEPDEHEPDEHESHEHEPHEHEPGEHKPHEDGPPQPEQPPTLPPLHPTTPPQPPQDQPLPPEPPPWEPPPQSQPQDQPQPPEPPPWGLGA